MSEAQEMVKILAGSPEQKKLLFDQLIEKSLSGEQLEDYEVGVLNYLKKVFTQPIVGEMSATVVAQGGIK